MWQRVFLAAIALLLGLAAPARAELVIDFDIEAADRTIAALGDRNLTPATAEAVARLPGNQAIIRKINEMGGKASTDSFAKALVVAAQGGAAPSEYGFDLVIKNKVEALALINRIRADEPAFKAAIADRIRLYAPARLNGTVSGYLFAGGPVDGFAFTETDFFLDVARLRGSMDDTREMFAHELFHAVQHFAIKANPALQSDVTLESYKTLPAPARACFVSGYLFGELKQEGLALLVGDGINAPAAGAAKADNFRQVAQGSALRARIDLLETLIRAGTSADPMDLDRLYDIGFYSYFTTGRPPLYALGKFMAEALAGAGGPQAIAAQLGQDPRAFIRAYQALAGAKDSGLPSLGPDTLRWAAEAGCNAR
jgi:hypothetical protein